MPQHQPASLWTCNRASVFVDAITAAQAREQRAAVHHEDSSLRSGKTSESKLKPRFRPASPVLRFAGASAAVVILAGAIVAGWAG